MMIPITRKEKYINEIAGGGNTAPETPQTREEIFFADILGEVVAPSPITRAEKYLAKIANKYSGELPEPVTRIERFIARAAGMDVVTPVPLTKEEIFWANYKGREQIIEGIPPLTFKSNGANLSNYRIYGNTVSGESVGDLVESGEHAGEYRVPVTINSNTTSIYLPHQIRKVGDDAEYIDFGEQKQHRVRKNLFSAELEQGNISTDGILVDSATRLRTKNYIPCEKGDYVLSFSGENIKFGCRYYDANYNIISSTGWIVKNSVFIIERINTKYIKFNFTKNDTTENISPSDITDIQLEKGSTATEYEPYIENTEVDVTLPVLPTLSGTNTLSFETTVQPSKVMIKTGKFGTHKVRYYDSDGTFLSAEDVKDGTNAQGFTPTKASTAQYNYTFMGWSTTKGSTTAETGVLNDITADKSLYAVFSQSLRTFTVYFYNDSALLQTAENVQYGGTATYTGEAPTKDGFTFSEWQPSNVNITADTSCYAQFVEG